MSSSPESAYGSTPFEAQHIPNTYVYICTYTHAKRYGSLLKAQLRTMWSYLEPLGKDIAAASDLLWHQAHAGAARAVAAASLRLRTPELPHN